MQTLLYVLLILLSHLYICKHITIPCSHFMKSWMLFMRSTTSNELYVQIIDLESPVTVISTLSAETVPLTETKLPTETLETALISETVSIGDKFNIIVPNMYYYAIKKQYRKNRNYDSYSAFSLGMSDYKLSLTHILKEQKLIDRNIFSFEFYNNTNEGFLHFGTLPHSITSKYKYKGNIKMINNNSNNILWEFNLNYFNVNGTLYNVKVDDDDDNRKGNSFFRSIDNNILIPSSYYKDVLSNLIGNSIDDSSCRFHSQYQQYTCDCDEMNIVGNIVFGIGDVEIVFEGRSLFKVYDLYCILLIKENTLGNEWVFGTTFMDRFLISFDYQTKEVTLYSNNTIGDKLLIDNINNNNSQNKNYIKHICIFEIIFGSIFSAVLLSDIYIKKLGLIL